MVCYIWSSLESISSIWISSCTVVKKVLAAWENSILCSWEICCKMSEFLQGISVACYAERCISYGRDVRLSVRPSVRHTNTMTLYQNDAITTSSLWIVHGTSRGDRKFNHNFATLSFELSTPTIAPLASLLRYLDLSIENALRGEKVGAK